jgi:hypothetical protein
MKHRIRCYICDMIERRVTPDEVRDMTPPSYGYLITFDHLNYMFDRHYDSLSRFSLPELFGEMLHWALRPRADVSVVALARHNSDVFDITHARVGGDKL